MDEFRFLQPYWLVVIPFIIYWFNFKVKRHLILPPLVASMAIRYPPLLYIAHQSQKKKQLKLKNNHSLVLLFCLFSFALAQPVSIKSSSSTSYKNQTAELILLVNTSVSMVIKDYQIQQQPISRLAFAQHYLTQFIDDYSGKQYALLLHANPAMLWLPLTNDKEAVKDAVNRIDPALGGRISDLGASLNLVLKSFTTDQEKVVLLVADGSLQQGKLNPEQIAKNLAKKGFTLYIIAMGKQQTANNNSQNQLLFEPVNLKALKAISDAGNGKLFHIQDGQSFKQALKVIQKKHSKKIAVQSQNKHYHAWYNSILLVALFLLLIMLMPNVKGHHNV